MSILPLGTSERFVRTFFWSRPLLATMPFASWNSPATKYRYAVDPPLALAMKLLIAPCWKRGVPRGLALHEVDRVERVVGGIDPVVGREAAGRVVEPL